ncbi:translation initiation factor eIF-2B [Candidatus Woesearchaeota archaeon]|jgi:translation initiation factor 2B subunit (eIF-2B alpha/beta/delta family)|nr:translation initiation factor eIF-2B [Candidatus Woesearchaeota archaeon]
MSLEKAAKEVKNSLNSISSLFILLSSVSDIAKSNIDSDTFSSSLYTLRDVFFQVNYTDSSVKNVLNYVLAGGSTNYASPKEVLKRVGFIRNYIKDSQKKIALLGERKLIGSGKVFVFGYDPLIMEILKRARSNGKKFSVHNTEMRPSFYGRKFAGELSRGGIKVTHYADLSLKDAMGGADVVFSGCQSILSNGNILGASGFEMAADFAFNLGIPLYVCAPSWKIDSGTFAGHNPEGYSGRLWSKAPQGITLKDPLFDVVDSRFITGIISELGVYAPHNFMDEVKYENMWKF